MHKMLGSDYIMETYNETEANMKIGMSDLNGESLKMGDKVKIANGQIGEIVYECGAFGVAIEGCINYEWIQNAMDNDDWCCGNSYSGVMNDNFISLWELYWNSNSDEDICRFVEILESEKEIQERMSKQYW